VQCRIENRGQDSRIIRVVRMRLMQACSNNATSKAAADEVEVKLLF
jgi:acetolactate synthase regulatory subunit